VNFPLKKRTFIRLSRLLLKVSEYEIKRRWYDALAFSIDRVQYSHWMSFTCARLTIHKVASMISIKDMKDQRQSTLLKYLCLWRLLSKNLAVLKVSLSSFLVIMKSNPTRRSNLDTTPDRHLIHFLLALWSQVVRALVFIYLMRKRRSQSYKYLNAFFLRVWNSNTRCTRRWNSFRYISLLMHVILIKRLLLLCQWKQLLSLLLLQQILMHIAVIQVEKIVFTGMPLHICQRSACFRSLIWRLHFNLNYFNYGRK